MLPFVLLAILASDPSVFVRSLYEQDRSGGPDPVYSVTTRAEIERTFTGPIVDLIWRDLVDAMGEVGRMDAHYLYDAQDNEVKNLTVRTLENRDGRARVLATFDWPSGKGSAEFQLVATKDGWRIANIVYPAGDYMKYLQAEFPLPRVEDDRTKAAVCRFYSAYPVQVPEGWDADESPIELAEMFANGDGVEKDFSAALYFLCTRGANADAETWSMIETVLAMERGAVSDPLDYCEHATSRDGGIICASRRDGEQTPALESRFETFRTKFPGAAMDALRERANAFLDADAFWEAEQSRGGTMYAYAETHARLDREEAFIGLLEKYTAARAPAASEADLKHADADLNAAYRKRMKAIEPCEPEYRNCSPPLEPENLRDAQRAWIPYRDAWIAFYQQRWRGAASAEALRREIATALTRARIADLAVP